MKRWVLVLSGCLAAATATGEELVAIHGPKPGQLEVRGFRLEERQLVEVVATGVATAKKGPEIAAAWILDADTRQVVWRMGEHAVRKRRRELVDFRDLFRLDAGVYEAYYTVVPIHQWHLEGDKGWFAGVARSVSRFFGLEERAWRREHLRLVVRGTGDPLGRHELVRHRRRLRQRALLSLPATSNDAATSGGFVLSQPTQIEIYAIGELDTGEGYDFGWIAQAESGRKIWVLSHDNSQWAGGAQKNRLARTRLRLPAGRYGAHFVTDGSHSPDSWNALPPFDPSFWGLTLWVEDPAQAAHAEVVELQSFPEDRIIVEITRMGDDARIERGFSLAAPAEVRVYAVGEGSSSEMVDFGWIARARTHEVVWSMRLDRTRHAGGAGKNRVADEIIHLGAGDYVAGFVTDDSHSFGRWNAAAPTHPKRWGITLLGLGKGFGPAMVSDYNEESDPSILARIERVTDSQHERSCFSLDRPTRVMIYALGEALGDEMFDYGWIEYSRTSRVVWSMRAARTECAGGAAKNRRARQAVRLPAGDYCAHYKTDDSHAYGDWNADPPDDPAGWGIRITRLDD